MKSILEHYEMLDEETLYHIAINESTELTDEAVDALIQILTIRGYNKNVIKNIINQRKDFSDDDLFQIAIKFSNTRCSICNKETKINAIRLENVKSMIFFTLTKKLVILGCKHCLEREKKSANNSTLLLGWWSIYGVFKTPYVVISNILRFKNVSKDFTNLSKDFTNYVKNNRGLVLNLIESS